MEPAVADTYSNLAQRFAMGFLLHIVTNHQGIITDPTNQVQATLFLILAVIVENYFERKTKQITKPSLALFRDWLMTIWLFIGTLLVYFLIAAIDGMFEDVLSSTLSINNVYRQIILITTIALIITLLKFFAGEITTKPKVEKEKKSTD